MADALFILICYFALFVASWFSDHLMQKQEAVRQAETPTEHSPEIVALKERWSKMAAESH